MVKGKSQHIEGIYKFISNYEKKYNIKFGAWEGLSLGNIGGYISYFFKNF